MRLVLLGGPGAGKGTQAKMLKEKYDLPHISTGDIFRANINNNTDLGKEAKKYMDKGLLVPDELVGDLVIDRIAEDDCKNGYIFDGFPRTIPQAKDLDKSLESSGEKIDFVINIEVEDENIIRRMSGRRACLKCGATYHIEHIPPKKEGICDKCGSNIVLRDDDAPETVRNRLVIYHEQTQPLIDYYNSKGNLISVDGSRPMKDIHEEIIDYIERGVK
ncbi:MAG TPA: adenylate kinase [Clostridiales bacterium]|nr:adenylate kinase [Clostridiales bacterium]